MTNDINHLRKELRDAGASPAEVSALTPIALRLSLLKNSSDTGEERDRWAKLLKPVALGLGGLIVGALLIIASQSVLPGNVLYPLQRLSDNVAVAVRPAYRANVMMKHAQQVNELVANGASSDRVMSALGAYNREMSTYKMQSHVSYAAFEFCKSNLEQAASSATPPVAEAINNSLNSLKST